MLPQGFLVLFVPQGSLAGDYSALQSCPLIGPSRQAVLDGFAREYPGNAVVAALSFEDLGKHRRSLLELAEQSGSALSLGFGS